MAQVATIWRHVIVNTLYSWLHGDPRGFRDHDHRIHSSGDYKNPPPPGEHAGLHRWARERSGTPAFLAPALRPTIASAFAAELNDNGWTVLAVSVSDTHLHALAKLPEDRALTRRVVGEAKKVASRLVRREMPGRIWSAGGTYKPVRTRSHLFETFEYIRSRQEHDAFVLVPGTPEDHV
jgi:REP element-mobilizing transposase RayT